MGLYTYHNDVSYAVNAYFAIPYLQRCILHRRINGVTYQKLQYIRMPHKVRVLTIFESRHTCSRFNNYRLMALVDVLHFNPHQSEITVYTHFYLTIIIGST